MERGITECGIIVLAIMGGLLAGCGGGPAESYVDVQAMARLREVLNKDPQLPDGFSARSEEPWRVPFAAADHNCRAALDPAAGRAPALALTAQAAASFEGDELGEVAGVGLARYAGSEAEGRIEELTEALEACRTVRAGGGTRLRLTMLPVEDVGDEVVGAELRGRLNGYPYALDVMLARSGDTLVSVVHTGIAKVDPERTRQVLSAAVGMVSA